MNHVEVVALLAAGIWLLIVVEMIRRHRFSEGYALLWLLSGIVLLILAIWRDLLDLLAATLGIFYPPTALFVIAFGLILLLMMQQSAAICELVRRNSDLTQRVALLSLEVEVLARAIDSSSTKTQEATVNDRTH